MTTSVVSTTTVPVFEGLIGEVTEEGLSHSWRPGCPVSPTDLRSLEVTFWDFEGTARRGELIVHADHAQAIFDLFGELFALGYPMTSVTPIGQLEPNAEDRPGYNNTSAFNCRLVEGTTNWSEHARGLAIDINPQQNPFVQSGGIWPEDAGRFVDRTLGEPGMLHSGDPVVEAFESIGWAWGGYWTTQKDYHHFSASGR
jgi:hypothetical protein